MLCANLTPEDARGGADSLCGQPDAPPHQEVRFGRADAHVTAGRALRTKYVPAGVWCRCSPFGALLYGIHLFRPLAIREFPPRGTSRALFDNNLTCLYTVYIIAASWASVFPGPAHLVLECGDGQDSYRGKGEKETRESAR